MKIVVLTLLLLALTCAAFASDKQFAEWVSMNKEKLRDARQKFRECKKQCLDLPRSCFRKCLAQKLNKQDESDDVEFDDVLNAFFDSTITNDSQEEQQSDANTDAGRATNNAGVNLVKSFEGFRSCVYLDAVGKKTIGYGHLIKSGESFSCISEAQAVTLLKKDLGIAESCVSRAVKRSINDNQFAALVSFTFNLGCGNLQSSTLLKKVNAGSGAAEVCAEFARWNKAGGKVLPGLTRRRAAECDLYKK